MEKLSYKTLENVGYDGYLLKDAKEKVLQFGEGNFLRAFVDYWFDLANEKADWNGKCCLVQPIAPGLAEMINEQDGLYTLHLRGSVNGEKVDDKRIISSVSRCLNPYQEEGSSIKLGSPLLSLESTGFNGRHICVLCIFSSIRVLLSLLPMQPVTVFHMSLDHTFSFQR